MTPDVDIGKAVSRLLENPEALGTLMNIAGGLMSSDTASGGNNQSSANDIAPHQFTEPERTQQSSESEPSIPAISKVQESPRGLSDTLEGLLALAPKSNDPRAALLTALKPYLNPSRCERVDSLIKALRLATLASTLFNKKLF